MPHRPFTAAWAAAFREILERSEAYRAAAARWTAPMALVLEATPQYGYDSAVAVELTLERGRCLDAVVQPRDAVSAPFVLSATYDVWKSVVRGTLDPIVAVTSGRISLRGSLTTLMLNARVPTALLECARLVPTDFPDEAAPGTA